MLHRLSWCGVEKSSSEEADRLFLCWGIFWQRTGKGRFSALWPKRRKGKQGAKNIKHRYSMPFRTNEVAIGIGKQARPLPQYRITLSVMHDEIILIVSELLELSGTCLPRKGAYSAYIWVKNLTKIFSSGVGILRIHMKYFSTYFYHR